MEVGDDVIRISLLCVRRSNSMCNARQTTNGEEDYETDCKLHRRRVPNLAAPHCEQPVEDFYSGWNCDCHRCH